MIQRRAVAFLLLAGWVGGCGHSRRAGPPISLPAGDPRNACEQERWFELAPAQVSPIGFFEPAPTYSGTATFRVNEKPAADLQPLFPPMQEPQLESQHLARVTPIDRSVRRTLSWLVGGGGPCSRVSAWRPRFKTETAPPRT